MLKYYAVKHKTEERYLTGTAKDSPRLYISKGKAEAARKNFIQKWQGGPDSYMVVEWTISERVIPWQQRLDLQAASL